MFYSIAYRRLRPTLLRTGVYVFLQQHLPSGVIVNYSTAVVYPTAIVISPPCCRLHLRHYGSPVSTRRSGIGLADVGRLLQTARDEGGVRTARRPAQPSGDVAALTITAGRCGHSNFGGSVNSLTRMCPLKPFHSVRI
jgi:hypothetical protein